MRNDTKVKAILKAAGVKVAKTVKRAVTTTTTEGVHVTQMYGMAVINMRGYDEKELRTILDKAGFDGEVHFQ